MRDFNVKRVTPFNFSVVTEVDYDVNFMRDRLVSRVFVNDNYAGVYSAMALGEEVSADYALQHFGPDIERGLVDQFMGLGYRKQVRDLQRQVADLQAHINRVRWWQIRRRWAARHDSQED